MQSESKNVAELSNTSSNSVELIDQNSKLGNNGKNLEVHI